MHQTYNNINTLPTNDTTRNILL